jgi:hypothetical protein
LGASPRPAGSESVKPARPQVSYPRPKGPRPGRCRPSPRPGSARPVEPHHEGTPGERRFLRGRSFFCLQAGGRFLCLTPGGRRVNFAQLHEVRQYEFASKFLVSRVAPEPRPSPPQMAGRAPRLSFFFAPGLRRLSGRRVGAPAKRGQAPGRGRRPGQGGCGPAASSFRVSPGGAVCGMMGRGGGSGPPLSG